MQSLCGTRTGNATCGNDDKYVAFRKRSPCSQARPRRITYFKRTCDRRIVNCMNSLVQSSAGMPHEYGPVFPVYMTSMNTTHTKTPDTCLPGPVATC